MKVVNQRQLERAVLDVQDELDKLGLWEGSKLQAVDVYLSWPVPTLPAAYGFFIHGVSTLDQLLGFRRGHIYIPRFVVGPGMFSHRGLRQVLRHEYGHAVAHKYPWIVRRSSDFNEAFGGSYGSRQWENTEDYVTAYAKVHPSEDFAETWMTYLLHKGRQPSNMRSAALKKKWSFVSNINAQIAGN